MDALVETLDAKLREWKPETVTEVRECGNGFLNWLARPNEEIDRLSISLDVRQITSEHN